MIFIHSSPTKRKKKTHTHIHTMKPSQSLSTATTTPLTLLLLFFFFFSFNTVASSAPTHLYEACENTTTYNSNTTYQTNLRTLLFSLSSKATPGTRFHNSTAGQDPDKIYGHFLCRGDVTNETCQNCVQTATQEANQRCPNMKIAVIWYDECLLRYSNQSFFSIMEETPFITIWNTKNILNPNGFNQLLGSTMKKLANGVAFNSSVDKFATEKADFTDFQTLYTLGQCTPDLSGGDCNRCLRGAIANLPSCCYGKLGGRVLKPSCNLRFELYPFYSETISVSPPSPTTSSNRTSAGGKKGNSSRIIIAIVVPIAVTVALLGTFCYCWLTRKRKEKIKVGNKIESVESLRFGLGTIVSATKNFADNNKIGQGGFGLVYKGTLASGQEIAVKRLSRNSGQGIEEFKNEVLLVAKLHHRNLVRLLGFCLEGEEKILIYEFVRNKSLDYFLFDQNQQAQLDWKTRYKIIGGIARGLLYLHEDSQLRIVHRDLKASNVLLDGNMNTKISDFGIARGFGVDQSRASTRRIVGTYGYMSPEYAMHGQFSTKSDVYSFGVVVLEVISSKKSSSFQQSEHDNDDLLSYAWRHWNRGTALEMMNQNLREHCSTSEVMRCIHIALLCVQEDVNDRPTMGTVVLMLDSYTVTLPLPAQSPFLFHSRMESGGLTEKIKSAVTESDKSSSKSMQFTEINLG